MITKSERDMYNVKDRKYVHIALAISGAITLAISVPLEDVVVHLVVLLTVCVVIMISGVIYIYSRPLGTYDERFP